MSSVMVAIQRRLYMVTEKEFLKVLNNKDKGPKPYDTTAEVVRVEDGVRLSLCFFCFSFLPIWRRSAWRFITAWTRRFPQIFHPLKASAE